MNKTTPLALLIASAILALTACSADAVTSDTAATTPAGSSSAEPAPEISVVDGGTPITITAGDTVVTATLNESDAARDLVAELPLTLPATRVSGIEYLMELSAPLTETGPFYREVEAGDIVYWNPRDSVTVIYEPTVPVSELTKLGEVTSDLAVFDNLPDDVDMLLELAD